MWIFYLHANQCSELASQFDIQACVCWFWPSFSFSFLTFDKCLQANKIGWFLDELCHSNGIFHCLRKPWTSGSEPELTRNVSIRTSLANGFFSSLNILLRKVVSSQLVGPLGFCKLCNATSSKACRICAAEMHTSYRSYWQIIDSSFATVSVVKLSKLRHDMQEFAQPSVASLHRKAHQSNTWTRSSEYKQTQQYLHGIPCTTTALGRLHSLPLYYEGFKIQIIPGQFLQLEQVSSPNTAQHSHMIHTSMSHAFITEVLNTPIL